MRRKGAVRSRRKKHKKIRNKKDWGEVEALSGIRFVSLSKKQKKALKNGKFVTVRSLGGHEVTLIPNTSLYFGRKNERRFGKFLIGLGIFLLFLWILPHPYEAEIDKYTWHTLSYFSDFQLIFYGFGLILIGFFVLTSKLYYKKRQKLMWLFLILLILLGYYLH